MSLRQVCVSKEKAHDSKKSTRAKSKPKQEEPVEEPEWIYCGIILNPANLSRRWCISFARRFSASWRQRLDSTTNWVVLVTGATLSIAFSQSNVHHSLVLLNAPLVLWFLFIEARRYRYYELWSYRVRLMETDFTLQCWCRRFILHLNGQRTRKFINAEFPYLHAGSFWQAFAQKLLLGLFNSADFMGGEDLSVSRGAQKPGRIYDMLIYRPIPSEVMTGLGIKFYIF